MRRPSPSMIVATAALVLAAGGVGWAATLPRNSVGSQQIKTGAVRSTDIKNGGVGLVDLAPSARIAGPRGPAGQQGPQGPQGAAPFVAMGGTFATFGGCGQSGWCFVSDTGQGTLVARLSAAPPLSGQSWRSTGVIELAQAARAHLWSTATVWAFGSGGNKDVSCAIYDGASVVAAGGGLRMDGNDSQIVTIDRIVQLEAGTHDLRLLCRGNAAQSHAVVQATISYEAIAG